MSTPLNWQFYWPNWWKLWPSYRRYRDHYAGHDLYDNVFCFGPFQCRWWRAK